MSRSDSRPVGSGARCAYPEHCPYNWAHLCGLPQCQDERSDHPGLVAMSVDLTGSNCGPLFGSVRLLMDGSKHSPDDLRRIVAEHYDIPLAQVGESLRTTQEQFDAEEGRSDA